MKYLIYILLVVQFALAATPLRAKDNAAIVVGGIDGLDPATDESDLRVALALSGGGARGLCAIGLFRALEEKGIKVTAITGTSIGGVTGGLYACGYSPDELEKLVSDIDFGEILSDQPIRSSMFFTRREDRNKHLLSVRFNGLTPQLPQGLTGGHKLTSLLTDLTNRWDYLTGGDFTRLPIPFKTVATDVVTGELRILDSGTLAEAMRATMAFPLAFTGVERKEELLMDGGILVPVPVKIARDMCSPGDWIVALNTTSPLLSAKDLESPVVVANQVTSIMTADQLAEQLKAADISLEPVGIEFASSDFDDLDTLVEIGYQAGLRLADSLRTLEEHNGRHLPQYRLGECMLPATLEHAQDSFCNDLTGRSLSRSVLVSEMKKLVQEYGLFQLAAVPRPTKSRDDSSGTITFDLIVQPRPDMATLQISIKGNQTLSDEEIVALLDFSEYGTLSSQRLKQGLNQVVTGYRERGYDLADVRSVEMSDSNLAIIIDEAIIKRIDVDDNTRSKDWLVRSYLPLKSDQPFSSEQASRGMDQLYGTELFEQVSIHLQSQDGGAVLKVRVKERNHTMLRLGWHWDDEYQSEEFVQILDDNLFGIGLQYLMHAQYGNERQHYHAGFKIDRLFFTYLTANIRVFYHSLDRNLFDQDGETMGSREEHTWGASFSVGQQMGRLGTVSGTIYLNEMEIEDPDGNNYRYGLRGLELQSAIETLDRSVFPSKGQRHILQMRVAGRVLDGDDEFTRYHSLHEFYIPVLRWLTYSPHVELGFSRRNLPVTEKFYLGGLNSLVGFRTNELSGDKMLLLNQQISVDLPLNFYVIGRWHNGNVYSRADQIKIKNLYSGFGVSVAYDSPIGPFELGYGGGNSPKDHFYFNAGFSF